MRFADSPSAKTDLRGEKVTVIGAGLSGLVAAYLMHRRGLQVQIVEKNRIGGYLQSRQTPDGLVEWGPTSFRTTPLLREIAKVTETTLVPTSPKARRRYICHETPERWPVSVAGTFRTLIGAPRSFPIKDANSFPTFFDVCKSRFGAEFAEKVGQLATQGIFAARADELSARLALQNFATSRRLRKAGEELALPQKGFQAWMQALADWLRERGVAFRKTEDDSQSLTVFAGSLRDAQRWAQGNSRFEHFLAEFTSLSSVSLTSTTLFFDQAGPLSYPGFGVLFQHDTILGVVQMSEIFPSLYDDKILAETWISRDTVPTEQLGQFRQTHLKGRTGALRAAYPRTKVAWLPLYNVALEKFLNHRYSTGSVQFIGNYLGHLGLSGLSEQIEKQIEQFLETRAGCMA